MRRLGVWGLAPGMIVFVLALLWGGQALAGKITQVKHKAGDEAVKMTFKSTTPIKPDQISLKLDSKNKVVVIRINDAKVKRRWFKMKDRSVSRTLILPSKQVKGAAVVRIRMKKPWKQKQLDAARIKGGGKTAIISLPRTAAIAARWLKAKKKKVIVVPPAAPPPPAPPKVDPAAEAAKKKAAEDAKKKKAAAKKKKAEDAKKKKAAADKNKKKKNAKKKKGEAAAAAKAAEEAKKKDEANAAKPDEPKTKDKGERVEGELAEVGTIGLIPWENRFGLVIGIERLGEIFYAQIEPELNYTTKVLDDDLSMSFGLPMRIQIFDARADEGFAAAGSFRTEDYDEVSDVAKVIQRIAYGGKEERFYLDINRLRPATIGHGTVIKRYNPNLNVNRTRVGAHFDAFFDYAGFETTLNDVTGPDVVGALVFVKPLSLVDRDNYVMRSFSLGATVAADLDAPLRLAVDSEDVDNDGRRETEFAVDQDTFAPEYLASEVVSYGMSAEIKLVDLRELDWKTYFDFSFLETGVPLDREGTSTVESEVATESVRSNGATVGALIRMNLGAEPMVHALRLRMEYRSYEANHRPSYFDVLYEAQKRQHKIDPEGIQPNGTKLQEVFGRDDSEGRVNGGYFEITYKLSHYVAVSTGLEVNDATDDNNAFFHLEVPHIGSWQLAATYHRRTEAGVGDLFAFELDDDDLLIAQTRYGLADWFHINLEAATFFRIDNGVSNEFAVNLSAEFGFAY